MLTAENEKRAPSLANVQRAVMAFLYEDSSDPTCRVRPRNGLTPDALLSIYRHDSQAVFLNTLRLSYPVVQQLVGGEFFHAMAAAYRRSSPSCRGDLEQYGSDFGDFIERFAPVSTLPYLPDVARFEWLLTILPRSTRQVPIDWTAVSTLPVVAMGNRPLRLVSQAAVFASRYPVSEIWSAHQDRGVDLHSIDPTAGGERLLLVASDSMRVLPLSECEYRFYLAASQRQTLRAAIEVALGADGPVAIAVVLRRVHTDGALAWEER